MTRKKLSIIMIVAFVAVTAICQAEGRHLFILTGASGMEHVVPGKSFTPVVEKAFGKENVTVVRKAKGGRNIGFWFRGFVPPEGSTMPAKDEIGSIYDALMKDVKAATEGKTYDSVTLVWAHGARDGRTSLASMYADGFKGVLAQFKKDLNVASINVVIGRLNDWKGGMKSDRYKDWITVRKIQVKLAEELPNAAWVDSDDLNDAESGKKDALHNTKEGYQTSGVRFAEKAIELIRRTADNQAQKE